MEWNGMERSGLQHLSLLDSVRLTCAVGRDRDDMLTPFLFTCEEKYFHV